MNKILYILAAAVVVAGSATAQNKGLDRQVEITKEYVPEVEPARKLDIPAQMADTVTLKPEFSYGTIKPMAYVGGFGVQALDPMVVNVDSYQYLTPFYLKVGVGYPLNSVVDFYWADSKPQNLTYGAYLNHHGQFGKAKLDLNPALKRTALDMRNYGGGFVGKEWGRLALKANVDAFLNEHNAYGVFSLPGQLLTDYGNNKTLTYKGGTAGVTFGNSFTDLSYFNFAVGGELSVIANPANDSQSKMDIFGKIGTGIGNSGAATLTADLHSYFGRYSHNSCFTLTPEYEMHAGGFTFGVGAGLTFEKDDFWFFPLARVRYDIIKGYFIPFAELSGGLEHGDMSYTYELNPYVLTGLIAPDMAEYNFKAGIMGSFSDKFSYKAYFGFNKYRHKAFFANAYGEGTTARFDIVEDNCVMYTVGGNIAFKPTDRFSVWASAHLNMYDMDELDKAVGMPNFDLDLGTTYSFAPKWSATITGGLVGRRYFLERSGSDLFYHKADPALDVNLNLGYQHSRFIRIFAEGSNLFNSKLYRYNHYRSVGAMATFGVVLSF